MSTQRIISILLATLGMVATGLLVTGAPALAATGYKPAIEFGPEGPGLGKPTFGVPGGMAVDSDSSSPSYGDVYVSTGTLAKFSATGIPLSTLTLPEGTSAGAVAVDPNSGDVYVALSNGTLAKFTSAGMPVPGFELTGIPLGSGGTISNLPVVAVDPTDGDLFVVVDESFPGGSGSAIDQFNSSGAYVSQITAATRETTEYYEARDIAVDASGNVYATESFADAVGLDKFSFAGGVWRFNGVVYKDESGLRFATPIVVNPTNSDLYGVLEVPGGGGKGVAWYDASERPLYNFAEALTSVENYQMKLAVNDATGTVYVGGGSTGYVAIFEQVVLRPPAVTSQPATSVLAEGAVLHGTTDPEGLSTNYHFEYWTTSNPEPIDLSAFAGGSGFETATHTEVLSGLVPDTTYHVALVATNSEGTTTSEEQTFTTTALPFPEASTGEASAVTPYSATVTGTLNPNAIETTYHFEIGSDLNYGAQIYGSGIFAGPTTITQQLQNLQPGTTYHYRFVAVNQAGTTYGADKTFTTVAIPQAVQPPVVLPQVATPSIVFPTETSGARNTLETSKKGNGGKKGGKHKSHGKHKAKPGKKARKRKKA